MSLNTGKIDRKAKTAELLKFHEDKLSANGFDDVIFIPKCAYQPRGMEGLHVGFFESELKKGKNGNIFTEFVSIDLDPEDPDRNLWRVRYNPHYAEEYQVTEPSAHGNVRYLIPVDELIKVEYPKFEEIEDTEDNEFPDFIIDNDPNKDTPLKDATLRDLAAILLNKPVSTKKWLNEIITKK